ncbi:putative inactive purple acid phosphatase 1 isoform X2 [Prunus yedoensis var. nudiflora]|uniref:Putative inactive purple acid phosphatase 1 isoform X2 n=1 Tax=Prunus yedoensis var. nudiflora TaxID=2094558 RepID=A0A314XLP9_PRUYE|nr:putative inactive purple acid phosphatase 1 isoform X2 [Prunus yedoensis var. nudiflora]
MRKLRFFFLAITAVLATLQEVRSHGDQPLSNIAVHKAVFALHDHAYVKASPTILGLKGQYSEWVTLDFSSPNPSVDDWIGVFSPANFSASTCPPETPSTSAPFLCSAPIKYQYANYTSPSTPFVEWGSKGEELVRSPAGTLNFDRNSLCGAPARTVGWRDPGFIHTAFLKELWPNTVYTYKVGHRLSNGSSILSQEYQFRASPYPGQNSVQRVVIFGDMGKDEADGSNEYNNSSVALSTLLSSLSKT